MAAQIATAGVYSVSLAAQTLVGAHGHLPPVYSVCLTHPNLTVEYIRGSDRDTMRRLYDSLCDADTLRTGRLPHGGSVDSDLGMVVYLPRAVRALSSM